MINLDFSLAISAYAILSLSSLLIIWLSSKGQKERELSLQDEFIWFCSICSYTYINTREEILSICPRCGSYNKRER